MVNRHLILAEAGGRVGGDMLKRWGMVFFDRQRLDKGCIEPHWIFCQWMANLPCYREAQEDALHYLWTGLESFVLLGVRFQFAIEAHSTGYLSELNWELSRYTSPGDLQMPH